ncbi:MAG: aminotransferase class IV [Gammaproteobacteria bacterium]|nr:aminotransferase class IV [Gammaproteobacteria bacterium]
MNIVYLNGQYLSMNDAKVPVMDRGFLFGDGVYEYIPVYHGIPFQFQKHFKRLQTSLEKIQITISFTERHWLDILAKLIQKNAGNHLAIYLHITRGVAAKRDLAINQVFTEPTIFAACFPLPTVSHSEAGIKAITLEDIRWAWCYIKAPTLLPNILLRQQALDRKADEAILIRNGEALEGTQSNLFIVKNGHVLTPPKTTFVLGGITRDLILEIARGKREPIEETPISVAMLKTADEIWLTSSSREIAPVIQLDDNPVGNGKPGQIWQKMIKAFQSYKQELFKVS